MTFCCDIDGVLADYNRPMHRLLSQRGPMTPFPGTDPEVWWWYPKHGATPAMIASAEAARDDDWWATLPLHPDLTPRAVDLLTRLHDRVELTFVSARPCGREATLRWLATSLPDLRHPHVVHTQRKPLVLAGMEPDFYVEDTGSFVVNFVQTARDLHTRPCLTQLVNRPYNREYAAVGFTRAESTELALQRIADAVGGMN